jgi:sirohydrochlorin cobaltochelatase
MNIQTKKAILVVSFGTSYPATREATIGAIEKEIAAAFGDYRIYRAWTSRFILERLKKRDNLHIDNITEAMERMLADGITHVIVQPTHVIPGLENDQMKKEVLRFRHCFSSVVFGNPLLTDAADRAEIIRVITEEFHDVSSDSAVVLMGHGTAHQINSVYAKLDQEFKELGHPHYYLGTVEAEPSLETVLAQVRACPLKKVVLTPFMIVAGDHASNDMAGDEPDSWKNRFLAEGYEVAPVLKGLGEYAGVRSMFIRHVKEAPEHDQAHLL